MQEHFFFLPIFFLLLLLYLLQIVSAESNIKPIINTWMATKDDNKTGSGCLCVPMAREMTHQHLHLTFTYLLLSTCLSLCIWGNLHHLMFLFLCQTCPMCFVLSSPLIVFFYGTPVIVGSGGNERNVVGIPHTRMQCGCCRGRAIHSLAIFISLTCRCNSKT
ncbi:hypothetical protein M752DRAFT_78896 [Aspergillus phoenicis ATCC 13157]|uniref:Uncharacterized protein n=2 Tax=Aspergillus TaxID=5052 RepID=A0A370P8D0_ASPPH|nr:hypothetical protein M752DRAFT_78896 [Aspergillus phoenicis ATCC 13157]